MKTLPVPSGFDLRRDKARSSFFSIFIALAFAFGLFVSSPTYSSSLGDVALPATESDILRVFYAPFDAPFLKSEYGARITSILSSLDSVGQSSLLNEPSVLAYDQRLSIASIPDYALSKRGKALR